jgi:hypothetical protein
VFEGYEKWFREVYMPELLAKYAQEELYIKMEDWLAKDQYTPAYREKMRRAARPENRTIGKTPCQYESFPKIELNFCPVPHEYKDTPYNDVKERQICGPTDEKKIVANAFVNAVETLAHKYYSEYCGRKNWMEICKDIEESISSIPDIIFGAADGSAFDTTQLPQHNKLMNELFIAILNLPNITLEEGFDKNEIIQVLNDSLHLDISVDHGQLKFRALGRASGDGWTTCGNTHLMLSYWRYCFYKAEVPMNRFSLRAKGDDVILWMSRKYKQQFEIVRKQLFTTTKDPQMHGLGQICKKIDYGDITELDFLSCHFFYTEKGRLRMTRIPARVLQTTSYSTKYLPQHGPEMAKYLCHSKGSSLLAWSRGLPIFEKLANKMIELGKPGPVVDYNYYSDFGRVWVPKDDYRAYCVYLNNTYGITKQHVAAIEKSIDSLTHIEQMIDVPCLALFFPNTGPFV